MAKEPDVQLTRKEIFDLLNGAEQCGNNPWHIIGEALSSRIYHLVNNDGSSKELLEVWIELLDKAIEFRCRKKVDEYDCDPLGGSGCRTLILCTRGRDPDLPYLTALYYLHEEQKDLSVEFLTAFRKSLRDILCEMNEPLTDKEKELFRKKFNTLKAPLDLCWSLADFEIED